MTARLRSSFLGLGVITLAVLGACGGSGGDGAAQPATVAAPTFSPDGGSFVGAVDVTLSSATEGASIRYTIDGSQPTASTGTVYGSAIHLTGSATLQAIAYASGMTPSAVVSKTFSISAAEQVLAPTASVDTGTFGVAQRVTLSCATPGATIRYTTDGSTPGASSPVYGSPIAVDVSTTLKAIALHAGMTDSPVMTRTYTLVAADPGFDPAGGSFVGSVDVTLASATAGASIRYTIDGSDPTAAGTVYSGPIHLTGSATIKAIASATGWSSSAVVSKTFSISAVQQVLAPTASVDTGTFGVAQSVTLSCATPGATIRYTTDGSTPDATSPVYGAPIAIDVNSTLRAIALHAGMSDSPVMTRTYTLVPAAPTFSPDGGSFLGSVDVTLASATPGASIRYTTDGSDPTAAATAYSGPIHLTGGATIKAIASVTGWSSSTVASRSFTLGLSGTLASNAKASDAAAAYAALQGLILSCGSKGSFVQQNPGQGVSEGTGYGMLAAVANADRTTFDGLWTFYNSNLDETHGLMNWKFTCSGATSDGKGSATDADLDVAMALVQAGCRWGPTYTDAARSLLSKIKAELPYPGDGWGVTACVNPSYLAPGYYRAFAKVAPTDAGFWNKAATDAYTTLNTVANATTGLVPNWEQNGAPGACGVGNNTGDFGYDALRSPWRIATDYRWWGADSAKRLLAKQVAWVQSKGGLSALTSDIYSLSGNAVGSYAPSAAFLGTFATATVASDPSTADAYYTTLLNAPTYGQYFPITLKALYLAFEAGMFDRCVQ